MNRVPREDGKDEMKKALVCTAVLLGTYAAQANTTETTQNTSDQIVISATRIETPIEQVGSSISVISAEEIKASHSQNLSEALQHSSGLQFTENGGPGTASSVLIRGANANHTLVLINGIRVNSNTTGGFDFSSIPVDMIESIEVLRGPQSALYGADALGGVINITTKKGYEGPLKTTLSTEIGQKGYRTGTANLRGGNKVVGFNAALSYYGLENHDIAANNGGSEDDPYERMSASAGLDIHTDNEGRIDLSILYSDDSNQLDGYKGTDNPLDYSDKEKIFGSFSTIQPIAEFYTQRASAGLNHQKYEGFTSGFFGGPVEYETTSYDASFQSDFSPIDSATLSVGYDFRQSEAENFGNFEKQHRTQHAAYINQHVNVDEIFFLNFGGRYDYFSDIDGKATWQMSASCFVLENSRLHGSAGTGYHAPTMNDLYYTYGGPPRTYLNPERSKSFDLGIEQTLLDSALVADLTYFYSDVEDLIAWAPTGPGGSWRPANINQAEIRGLETSITLNPNEDISTKIYYTLTAAEDAKTGNELPRRARHSGGVTTHWHLTPIHQFHCDIVLAGKRYDDLNNTTELKGYAQVNIGTRHHVAENTELVVNISNLFDNQYETTAGYANVGRIASLGVEVTF